MKLTQTHADLFAPGGGNLESALASTTHLGIGAHPDDLEIMAYPGICACRGQKNLRFSGVVATDGAGVLTRKRRITELEDEVGALDIEVGDSEASASAAETVGIPPAVPRSLKYSVLLTL